LLLNRVSNNVGGVKHFSNTLRHAPEEERHFALVENVSIQSKLARNQVSGLELVVLGVVTGSALVWLLTPDPRRPDPPIGR